MAQMSIRERRKLKREGDYRPSTLAREAEDLVKLMGEKWNIPKDDIYFSLAIDRIQAIYMME